MKIPDIEREMRNFSLMSAYYQSDESVSSFAKKNGISERGMYHIIRKFGELNPELVILMKKKALTPSEKDAELAALKRELLSVKKELMREKLRAKAFDTMIDVAEEMFNIPIRKKAGTEQ